MSELGTDPQKPRHETLSGREFEVLCTIAASKTLTEIAGDQSVSVKTISTHRTRIQKNMRMKNNADLVHYALRNELVQ